MSGATTARPAERLTRQAGPRLIAASAGVTLPARLRARAVRRRGGRGLVELFVAFDDPCSAIAAHELVAELERRQVDLRVMPVLRRGIEGDPAVAQKRAYALLDAARLARRRLGLELVRDRALPAEQVAFLAEWTAAAPHGPARTAFCRAALGRLWFESDGAVRTGDFASLWRERRRRARARSGGRQALRGADGAPRALRNAGCVDGGALVLRARPAATDLRVAGRARLGGAVSERLDYFYSYRSPYSYLSAPRVFALPRRFDVEVDYHGVIPMAMRGQAVPRAKSVHTIRDVAREARRLGMPFGRIHDPLGEGAMRCLQVGAHAARIGKEAGFVLGAGRGIWGEAVDVATDAGLRGVCERAGLEWANCRAALADEELRAVVARDTATLDELGHWGVPVTVLRGELFWGQDRIEDLEAALMEAGLLREQEVAA